MKQRINLFDYYHTSANKNAKVIKQIRFYCVTTTVILVIIFAALFIARFELNRRIKSLQKEEGIIIANIVNSQNKDSSLEQLVARKELIQTYLKDDVQFTPYYRLVQTFLANKPNVQLSNFSLNNKRETEFSFTVSDYDSYKALIQELEKSAFVKNFNELEMSGVAIEKTIPEDGLGINFSGTFKEINEKIN